MHSGFRGWAAFYIGDIVYGANDGIITTFAVVAAAAGAGVSAPIILILGIANLLADGFSMGASKYLSLKSEQSVDRAGSDLRNPIHDGFATFISFVIIGALPLIPFLIPAASENAFAISAVATGVTFFVVGAARSMVTTLNPIIAGFEMLVVGGVASTIAYYMGVFIEMLVR